MSRTATVLVTACCVLSVPAMFSGNPPIGKLSLHPTRQASTDLEVGGEFSKLPQGSTRYITYLDLLSLPQVTYTVSDDANFRGKTRCPNSATSAIFPKARRAAKLGTRKRSGR